MSPDADSMKRRARRAAGLCSSCGKRPPKSASYASCAECLAENAERFARYKAKWGRTIERQRAQRREHADANGLCRKCGEEPRKPGCVQCVDCLLANAMAKEAWRERQMLRSAEVPA